MYGRERRDEERGEEEEKGGQERVSPLWASVGTWGATLLDEDAGVVAVKE